MKTITISFHKKLNWRTIVISQVKRVPGLEICISSALIVIGAFLNDYYRGLLVGIGVNEIFNDLSACFKIEKIKNQ